MNVRNEGKASFVEFLSSIKFAHNNAAASASLSECPTHFAHFKEQARPASEISVEDQHLVRSAN